MSSPAWVLSVAIPRPLPQLFTYRLPEELRDVVQVGGWVKVPFGRKTTHAYVVEPPAPFEAERVGLKLSQLKDVMEVGEQGSVLPEEVLKLCRWGAEYYASPLGEMLQCAAPAASLGLRSAKQKPREITRETFEAKHPALTEEQTRALELLGPLMHEGGKPALLHGVTGSGKTEVYLALARRALESGRGVLILVPEIALTSQLHRRFEEGLGETVALWHSAVADGRRRDLGQAIRSGEIRVVVGARSAVFAPVQNLGLIVVDEEHDATYKQEDRVRYHARDLAVVRGKLARCLVLMGSASPSIETLERVREGKYALAELPTRYSVNGLPQIELVDLLEHPLAEGVQAPISQKVVDAIRETVAAGDQVIVFLNRRGFSAYLLCEDCGHVEECPECSLSLTFHKRTRLLKCHTCGHQTGVPEVCSACGQLNLKPMGAGTESVEEELPKLLADLRILRLDRDQITSTKRLEEVLETFRTGGADLLLGTQMLVKGHDFPGVTLVVVVLADALFRWPDFRAPERAYQILKQVAGRAGRGGKAGRVLVQTYQTDHPVLKTLTGELPEAEFLGSERDLRQELGYPPFGRMARLRLESKDSEEARVRCVHLSEVAARTEGVLVLGPSEAFVERVRGLYRWDLTLRSPKIQDLQAALLDVRDVAVRSGWPLIVDVDPYSI